MTITTSYKTRITGYNNIFKGTLKIYCAALEYIIGVAK